MKRARIGILATAVLAVATMAFAQADFSGSWAPDVDPAAAAPAGGGGGGGRGGGMFNTPMTVKQTKDALTIERTVERTRLSRPTSWTALSRRTPRWGAAATPWKSSR